MPYAFQYWSIHASCKWRLAATRLKRGGLGHTVRPLWLGRQRVNRQAGQAACQQTGGQVPPAPRPRWSRCATSAEHAAEHEHTAGVYCHTRKPNTRKPLTKTTRLSREGGAPERPSCRGEGGAEEGRKGGGGGEEGQYWQSLSGHNILLMSMPIVLEPLFFLFLFFFFFLTTLRHSPASRKTFTHYVKKYPSITMCCETMHNVRRNKDTAKLNWPSSLSILTRNHAGGDNAALCIVPPSLPSSDRDLRQYLSGDNWALKKRSERT